MTANTEEMEMLRDSLHKLLDEIAPPEAVAKWDREDYIPRDLVLKMAELGVCGLTIPEEYGGLGMSILTQFMVLEELTRRSSVLGGLFVACAGYAGLNVKELGNEEQKRRLLPGIVEGRILFALGLSEPDVGGDLATVKTRAELVGDKVIINGAKRWCSGAEHADYIYALVRSGPVEDRYRNLSFIIIPKDSPGITITRTRTMGHHGSATNDVIFENVEVPAANIMGGPEMWNKGWNQLAGPTLEVEKLQPSVMALGIASGAVAEAWQYAQERVQGGKKICGHQAIRHQLAEVQTLLQTCRLMVDNAAQLIDRGEPSAVQTSMTKYYVSETARDITIKCQMILGAYGYAEGFNMERYVRDAMVLPIWGGSSNVQKNNIANLLGLPRG